MVRDEGLQARQGAERLGQIIQPKLKEIGLLTDFEGSFDHLFGGGAGDGDAEFPQSGAEQAGGDLGRSGHSCNRGIVQRKFLESKRERRGDGVAR